MLLRETEAVFGDSPAAACGGLLANTGSMCAPLIEQTWDVMFVEFRAEQAIKLSESTLSFFLPQNKNILFSNFL